MPKKISRKDSRTFLSLGEMALKLKDYTNTDPRFADRSKCARHLLALGMKADKKARKEALAGVSVKV